MNYEKARRNLMVFVGLFALSAVVGVTQREQATTLLPLQLAEPKFIPHILAVVVIYSIYNTGIAWALQDDAVRVEKRGWRWRTVDFVVTQFVAIAVLVAFFPSLLATLPKAANLSVQDIWPLLVSVAATAAAAGSFAAIALARRVRDLLRGDQLRAKLLGDGWVLNYNPQMEGARKPLVFKADGTIGDGRNENEWSWSLDGGRLKIWRQSGELQNEFVQSSPDRFASTNNPSAHSVRTRGINDQSIARDMNYERSAIAKAANVAKGGA